MPRLTISRIRMDENERLPDKSLILSTKGCTSLVYNHPDDPDRVLVYTVEMAKADYWREMEFALDRQWVGTAVFAGWMYPWYGYSRNGEYFRTEYDLICCKVPRVSFDFKPKTALWEERKAAIKFMDEQRIKAVNKNWAAKRTNWVDMWEELDVSGIPALADAARWALDYNYDLIPQSPKDAFCIWDGKLFWLDPYHEEKLLDVIRARTHQRGY